MDKNLAHELFDELSEYVAWALKSNSAEQPVSVPSLLCVKILGALRKEINGQQEIELLQDRLKTMAFALRPFAQAADDRDVTVAPDDGVLMVFSPNMDDNPENMVIYTECNDDIVELQVKHLRHARNVLRQTGVLEYN